MYFTYRIIMKLQPIYPYQKLICVRKVGFYRIIQIGYLELEFSNGFFVVLKFIINDYF